MSAPHLSPRSTAARRPRVGFLGLGWIGRSRLEVLHAAGTVEPVGVADPDETAARSASVLAGGARICRDLDELIALRPDGIVIATPTAQHAEQAVRALTSGCAVFCQKPLAPESAGTRRVLTAARRADRLLGVDLSYRHTRGMRRVRDLITMGAIGRVYAAELVFHNAYGPDKPWYYDPARSGGGCVLDLGIHLADLVLWALGFPRVDRVSARLMAAGRPLQAGAGVEDYATARVDLAGGTTALLTCSWNLPAGRDAVIRAEFYGTEGGLSFRNREGSFFEFEAQQYRRNTRETLCADAREDWWGAAALAWAAALAQGPAFDPAADHLIPVAELLDAVYGSASSEATHRVGPGGGSPGRLLLKESVCARRR